MSEQDVDQFLWELERELSHLDGAERRELLVEAERQLHALAERIATEEDAEDVTWYHYVQATAHLGPPETMAAQLTGEPLPDKQSRRRVRLAVAGATVLVVGLVLLYAIIGHGTLEPVGSWSSQETDLTDQVHLTFNVSEEAESVFLSMRVTPTNASGVARVTVLDGNSDLVFEGTASQGNHLERTTYFEGGAGTWRVILDLQDFTGAWRVDARQELP